MRLHASQSPKPGLYQLRWVSKESNGRTLNMDNSFVTPHGSMIVASDELEDFLDISCPVAELAVDHSSNKSATYLALDEVAADELLQSLPRLHRHAPFSLSSAKTLTIKHEQGHILNLPEIQEELSPFIDRLSVKSNHNPFHMPLEEPPRQEVKGIAIPYPPGKTHPDTKITDMAMPTRNQIRLFQSGLIFDMEP